MTRSQHVVALHKETEVALGTMGIGLDYGGFGSEQIPSADMTEILSAFPRLKMKEKFADTCCRLVATKPETSSDNFLRDWRALRARLQASIDCRLIDERTV